MAQTVGKRCVFAAVAWVLLLAAALALLAVFVWRERTRPPDVCSTLACAKAAAYLDSNMDRSVDPCKNFYDFACGKFRRMNPITNVGSSWTKKFNQLIEIRLKMILESNSTSNSSRFDLLARKARRLYATCLHDEADSGQIQEILRLLGPLPAINDTEWAAVSLESFVAKAHRLGISSLFEMGITVDAKMNTFYRYEVLEPRVFGPSLELYSANSSQARSFRQAFRSLLVSVVGAVRNETSASGVPVDADAVLALETKIAASSMSPEERRDPVKSYNKWTLGQLKAKVPSFNWNTYFTETLLGTNVTLKDDEPLIVSTPQYFTELERILKTYPNLKTHLASIALLRMVERAEPRLSAKFSKAFRQYQQQVYGSTQQQVRWKYCVSVVNSLVTDIVSRLYVNRFFSARSLSQVRDILSRIRKVFSARLAANNWMDAVTKNKALVKLERIREQVAYPQYIFNDTWMDFEYRNLPSGTNFVRDSTALRQNMRLSELGLLRRNVDKDRWGHNEVIVAPDAAYHPYFNQLYIKVGILMPPMFDEGHPKYLNYGGVGMVIGHEITHGYDDENRWRDENGNLNNWWSQSAVDSFQNAAKCFVDQYSAFEVVTPGQAVKMNGKLTLGENIADNGGLTQAYEAYRNWVKNDGEEQRLPGLPYTPIQLFFINYGQNWCSTKTDSELLLSVYSGPHSPDRFRVLGVVSNMEGFQKAFHCKKGAAMNREKKCAIWR